MAPVTVLLDVDGALCPYASRQAWDDWIDIPSASFPLWVARPVAAALRVPEIDLRWLTSWGDDANRVISPAVGWPDLPVLTAPATGRHGWWKLDAVLDHLRVDPGPVVWIDDEIRTHPEVHRLVAQTGCDHLLIAPHRDLGLRAEELTQLRRFVGRCAAATALGPGSGTLGM